MKIRLTCMLVVLLAGHKLLATPTSHWQQRVAA